MNTPLSSLPGTTTSQPGTVSVSGHPPALADTVNFITATNRVIASAFEHGRKAARLRDVLIARVLFACARRLARLAYRVALAGKRRVA